MEEHLWFLDAVKQRAHGRWSEVLAVAGVEERILRHRNGPCPACGGNDRFQYTDKFGEGNYHCRSCGAGGGFKLLQAGLGLDHRHIHCRAARSQGAAERRKPAPASLKQTWPRTVIRRLQPTPAGC